MDVLVVWGKIKIAALSLRRNICVWYWCLWERLTVYELRYSCPEYPVLIPLIRNNHKLNSYRLVSVVLVVNAFNYQLILSIYLTKYMNKWKLFLSEVKCETSKSGYPYASRKMILSISFEKQLVVVYMYICLLPRREWVLGSFHFTAGD